MSAGKTESQERPGLDGARLTLAAFSEFLRDFGKLPGEMRIETRG
jgi:hypothetical protein